MISPDIAAESGTSCPGSDAQLTTQSLPFQSLAYVNSSNGRQSSYTLQTTAFIKTYIDTVDWSATSVGPPQTWPKRLLDMFDLIMRDSRACAIWWGEDRVFIYNEPYSVLAGSYHPRCMGRKVVDTWTENSQALIEEMDAARDGKESGQEVEMHIFPNSMDGKPEERFFKWSFIPIFDGLDCQGWLFPIWEVTQQKILDRRMNMLESLGRELAQAKDTSEFWNYTMKAFETFDESDVPFMVLYVTSDTASDDSESQRSTNARHYQISGSLGVSKEHPELPSNIDFQEDQGVLVDHFRNAISSTSPWLLETSVRTVPFLEDNNFRGSGCSCSHAVVCTIRPTQQDTVMGFFLLGVNPRRSYDEAYKQFLSLLSQKMGTALASSVLLEEEARRRQRALEIAASEQRRLSAKLATRTREAEEVMRQLQATGETVPVGVCVGSQKGDITYANSKFFEITGIPKDSSLGPMSFLEHVHDEDQSMVMEQFKRLSETGITTTFELRWKPRTANAQIQWALVNSTTDYYPGATDFNITTSLTNITDQKASASEANRRAFEAEQLSHQLAIMTREAKANEEKFVRLSETATFVGIGIIEPNGRLIYANKTWQTITRAELRQNTTAFSFEDLVVPDDAQAVQRAMFQLRAKKIPVTFECRYRYPYEVLVAPGEAKIYAQTWVLCSAYPEVDATGAVKYLMCCLTDISQFKWAESLQKRIANEALESKRQQENFIDMTSHEMRNPLSAILQCAEMINETLVALQGVQGADARTQEALDSSIEAARTIVTCAQHQKLIVDDILTMSKLDSALVKLAPIPVRAQEILKDANKLFVAESRRAGLELRIVCDKSIDDFNVDWMVLDSSRLRQILINLLTNALKFTSPNGSVTVTMSASKMDPKLLHPEVAYVPSRSRQDTVLASPMNGTKECNDVFLHFKVQDTGRGLNEDEKKVLFKRFSQASPRTHIKYGGSGLGLFISRGLTELQGGEIGVASSPGQGSTFAFYIKAICIPPPVDQRALKSIHLTPKTTDTTNLSILVVEDNLVNQAILAKQLRRRGCTVYTANHGQDALNFLQTTRLWRDRDNQTPGLELSVILLDIEMPIMDGLTCVRKIRELQHEGTITTHVPIIAVSANARSEQIEIALAAGMDDTLTKPFSIPDLFTKIEVLLASSAVNTLGLLD